MAHRPPQTNVKLTKVKEYLDNNKINYAELGRRLGYSRGYISKIMGKERPLTEEFIMHLLCSKIK